MTDMNEFLATHINKADRIAQLRAEIKALRKNDKEQLNKDLHELMPALPPEWVLVRCRPKKEGNGQTVVKKERKGKK